MVQAIDHDSEAAHGAFEQEWDRTQVPNSLNDSAAKLQAAYDDENPDSGHVVTHLYIRNSDNPSTVVVGGVFGEPDENYVAPRNDDSANPVSAAQEVQRQAEVARADEPTQYSAGDQAELGEKPDDETAAEESEEDSGGEDAEGDYDPTEATVEDIKTWAAQETSRDALNRALRKERAGQGRVTAIDAMVAARDAAESGS